MTRRRAGSDISDLGDLVRGDLFPKQSRPPLLLVEPLLLAGEPALELGQPAVSQLDGTIEVIAPLGVLDVAPDLLDLLPQCLELVDRLPFGLPLRRHRVGLCSQVGELLAQALQPAAAGLVGLLAQRGLLDLELHHAAGDRVELLGIESISVRTTAHASSTRSIALSGMKRSAM